MTADRILIVGSGHVGGTLGALMRQQGWSGPIQKARVAHNVLSDFVHDYHRARGVEFRLAAGVAALEGESGRVRGVRLADGGLIDCDAVWVGVGGVPNQELAEAAGLQCANGVVVDLAARTSDPNIYAIGD